MSEKYEEPVENQSEKEARVFNLNVELADMSAKKKSTVKAFNEEIKRIKAEINDIIAPNKETFEVI